MQAGDAVSSPEVFPTTRKWQHSRSPGFTIRACHTRQAPITIPTEIAMALESACGSPDWDIDGETAAYVSIAEWVPDQRSRAHRRSAKERPESSPQQKNAADSSDVQTNRRQFFNGH